MTQKQFHAQIRKLLNRVALLRQANDGKLKMRRIDVKKCVVPEHMRSAHTRLIAPSGWKKPNQLSLDLK